MYDRAVDYWIRAGGRALRRFAYAEAVEHLTTGVAALKEIDAGETRDRLEIRLRAPLGAAYIQSRGFGGEEVEETYTRTLELCDILDDGRRRFDALFGLCVWYMVRGEQRRSGLIAGRVLALAEASDDPTLTLVADLIYGIHMVFVGNCFESRDRLERALKIDDSIDIARVTSVGGGDPVAYGHLWLSLVTWKMGYPDQGRDHLAKALARAEDVDNPGSRAGAMTVGALTLLECGALEKAIDMALEGAAFAKEQGLPDWEAAGLGTSSNAKLRLGLVEEAEVALNRSIEMRAGVGMAPSAICGSIGADPYRTRASSIRRSNCSTKRCPRFTGPANCGSKPNCCAPRRRPCRRRSRSLADAEACFLKARDVAEKQGAKSYALRASFRSAG